MKGQEKYSTYLFEDFLQDDFFIESIKRPTDKSVVFWNHFLEDYPEHTYIYLAAKKFVEDAVYSQISDEEIAEMWANIQIKSKPVRTLGKMKKLTYSAMAVAASIAILLVARVFLDNRDDGTVRNDIMAFVGNQPDSMSSSGDIQLILSEQKTVYLQGKESVITYDSANVHTGSEKVSKNEIASYNQLMVPYGKSSVLTFHDGTKIWVNAGTKLVYLAEFEKDKREIYVNGEIFLDVVTDTQRPFIVRTNDLQIQVVGTRFNVQAYSSDDRSRVALESGLVKIISKTSGDVVLMPNKIYEQDKSGYSFVQDADVRKYISWIYGWCIYESERLDVILKRLERYYGKKIVAESSVSEMRCSGKLDMKENIIDVLSAISKTAPVEYVEEGEKYIVKSKKLKNMPMENP